MLTEEKVIDSIEVLENGVIQVRQVTRIKRDDEIIAKSYHRWCLTPGQDVSEFPPNVQAICNTVWTDEVISMYQASIQENAF